jgi:hypothetical protein
VWSEKCFLKRLVATQTDFQKPLRWTGFLCRFVHTFSAAFKNWSMWLLIVFGNPFVTALTAFQTLFNHRESGFARIPPLCKIRQRLEKFNVKTTCDIRSIDLKSYSACTYVYAKISKIIHKTPNHFLKKFNSGAANASKCIFPLCVRFLGVHVIYHVQKNLWRSVYFAGLVHTSTKYIHVLQSSVTKWPETKRPAVQYCNVWQISKRPVGFELFTKNKEFYVLSLW